MAGGGGNYNFSNAPSYGNPNLGTFQTGMGGGGYLPPTSGMGGSYSPPSY